MIRFTKAQLFTVTVLFFIGFFAFSYLMYVGLAGVLIEGLFWLLGLHLSDTACQIIGMALYLILAWVWVIKPVLFGNRK